MEGKCACSYVPLSVLPPKMMRLLNNTSKHDVHVADIVKENGLDDKVIKPGMILLITLNK